MGADQLHGIPASPVTPVTDGYRANTHAREQIVMTNTVQHQARVRVNRDGVVMRRDFLKGLSTSGLAAGTLSWTEWAAANTDELRRQGKSCILLWMSGGPSQYETFSPKPDNQAGGETQAISTTTAGIQVAQNLPKLAQQMQHLSIIRSMTSREGSHTRASFLLHTGYLPAATVKHPTWGSIVAHEIGDPDNELPAFVRIGSSRRGGSGGMLGVEYNPFVLSRAGSKPSHSTPTTSKKRFERRLELSAKLERDYEESNAGQLVRDHQELARKSARMILSPKMDAFDVSRESGSVRDAYGRSSFGTGCLVARRLVEAGVSCIEVVSNGWDTHRDNFQRSKQLTTQIDQPAAHLVADLHQRGLLDNTLVIWMGEFGRTPRINGNTGRDHYPRAWTMALAGGGIQGGQVIGKTDSSGARVADRPVTVADLFSTFCKSLHIDPTKENMSPIGRPIKIVDGGKPVDELFG